MTPPADTSAAEREPSEPSKPRLGNLGQRLLTAVVLIPLISLGLFLDPTPWSILALSVLVLVLAGDEYMRMSLGVRPGAGEQAWGLRICSGLVCAALVVLATLFGTQKAMAPALAGGTMILATAVLVRREHLAAAAHHFAAALSGLLYVPMLGLVWPLLKQEFGGEWLFLALALAFMSDSFAYFAGRMFGRTKLYEAVSPKKTIEGSIGGLLGGVVGMIGMGTYWLAPALPISHAVVLGVIGSVLGQIGDLVESMLKRTFGVKDSGNILPGHGGLLDRIDAALFVAPLVYYYLLLVYPGA